MNPTAALELTQSFLILAEELNFRRTAQRLSVDQSALTRRIQKLEHFLGFALFERTTREVSLTPAGRSFYDANAGLLHAFSSSVRAARRVADGKTGVLRVGYMAFAAIDVMPLAVARFRERSPEVDVRLSYVRTQGQKLALSDGNLDLGYMIGPFDHPEYHSMLAASDQLCVIAQAGHPLSRLEVIRPADLAGVPMILGDMVEWEAYRWRLDDMFAAAGVKVSIALEASNTLALIGLVSAGLGVTIYPRRLARILGSGLAARPIADQRFRVDTILVWKRTNGTAGVRSFIDIAKDVGTAGEAA
jgi:DNA-binding transcriptional LysR family regulator